MKDAQAQRYARYTEGLNDFRYCATLHVEHPSMSIFEVSSAIGLEPDSATEVGGQRPTPKGKLTGRTAESTFWRKELPLEDNSSLDQFVRTLVDQLKAHKAALQDVQSSGGTIVCFVGIFASSLCDTQFGWKLLQELAELRIDLRLDYYSDDKSGLAPSSRT